MRSGSGAYERDEDVKATSLETSLLEEPQASQIINNYSSFPPC